MISRLLVAVLLLCAVAITTPNSTEAASEKQLAAPQSQSSSSKSSSSSSYETHDRNHYDAPRKTVALQVVDGPNPSGDREDVAASEINSLVSRRRRNYQHQRPVESTFNHDQLMAVTFSDSHHKQTSQPESTSSGTISAAAVATAGASNQLNLKQQDSERTTSFTNVDAEQQQQRQQNTGSASSKSASENVDSQTRQQQQASTPSAAEVETATNSKNNGKNSQQKQQQQQHRKIFTNQFVIEIKGGKEEARRLAVKHGFIYLDHIIDDYYHLEHRRLAKRSIDSKDLSELDISIEEEPHVLKLERQVLKTRVQRDFMDLGAGPPPTSPSPGGLAGGGLGRVHAANNQQQRPMFWPSTGGGGAGRPAQFLRPANQLPATPPAPNGQYADTRRFGSAQAVGRYQQQLNQPGAGNSRLVPGALFDQLEMTSSGPPPFFLHANYSASPQQQQVGAVNKHRPPPPPLLASGGGGNQTAAFHYANDSARATSTAPFNDPSWPHMWYLDGGARNGFDLNVQAAWQMGYTGKGIVITILDDGLEKDHPDLQANYDPLASFDINGDDADPMPRYDANDSNRHGTRCAGEVAAVRDNNICSIGIAYNSRVGGVRMLDGDVTDAVEARSLGLNNQHIHIYSASWGPDDNGKTVDGPGELATRAFIEGVTNGRQGLGSIFVFASGNGGREHDNCNCDGYTNSIWTLSISSATQNGYVPWYIENCSSTLAATYSSGSLEEKQIATTDIRHSCTNNHTGTSASAPIAAGICALVLESNPRLTWRDMQHIVVRTAKPANLIAKDWRTNALGRNVSHAFGYGLMDAAAMIHVAKQWTTVPLQYTCEVRSPQMERPIPAKGYIELKLRAECANVRYLEHVQSKITLSASRRGDLHIYLTSPHGTRSTLLAQRPYDQADQGFRNWPFMTVHSWGESPNGVWTLEVHNDGKSQTRASLKEWTLVLYGTSEDPNKHLNMNSGIGNQATLVGSNSAGAGAHSATSPPPPPPVLRPPPPSFPPSAVEPRKPQLQQQSQQPNSISAPPPPLRPTQAEQTTTTTTTAPSSAVIKTTPPPARTGGGSTPTSSSEAANQAQWEEANNKNITKTDGDGDHRQSGASSRPQTPKVDFEIVSPSSSANQHHVNESSMPPADHHHHQDERPHILVIDNNKIDGQTSTAAPTTTTTNRPPLVNQQQNELDANQLDSRLTKDYRSSGGRGHDVPSTTSTTLDSESNQDLKLGPAGDPTNGDVDSALEQQQLETKQRLKNLGNNSALALHVGYNSWLVYMALISVLVIHRQTRVAALSVH